MKMPFMDGIELVHNADQREQADGLNKIVIDVISKPFSLRHTRELVRLALAA